MNHFIRLSIFVFALFLGISCGSTVFCAEKDKDGFVPLFNGKDLTGWVGNLDIWSVENGCIVGKTEAEGPKKLTYNTFLTLKDKEYKNFILKFDIKLTKGGNSGVQVRSWVVEGGQPYRVNGYQADFDGDHAHSGIVYGEGFRGILANRGQAVVLGDNNQRTTKQFATDAELKAKLKVEDWNSYEIIVAGNTISNIINGRLMSVCTDIDKVTRDSGVIAIQAHVGPPMKVEIKNFKIKSLED